MTTTLLTADDLFAMGEDCRCELVNGKLVPMPPSGYEASSIAVHLGALITIFVGQHHLGTTTGADGGYRLRRDPDIVRAPDFAFIARGRITPAMDRTKYLDLAPDLAVEVISPSELAKDIEAKILEYFDAGVHLIWVFYPNTRSVRLYRPGAIARILRVGDELSGEDVLPGFSCPVADLFPDVTDS